MAYYNIHEEKLLQVARLLLEMKAPMVPYKMDRLAFCEEAHRIKEELCDKALDLLPVHIVEEAEIE